MTTNTAQSDAGVNGTDKYEVCGISAGEGNFRIGSCNTLKEAREMAKCASSYASYYAYRTDGTGSPQYLDGNH